VVLEGVVTVFVSTSGGTVKVVDLMPPEILSGGPLLQRSEPCTVKSCTKSKLLLIPDTVFRDWCTPSVRARTAATRPPPPQHA
jgi:hypothetical protein